MKNKKRIFYAMAFMTGLLLVVCGILLLNYFAEQKSIKAHEGAVYVCFGDSIWDNRRDETGIAALVGEKIHANIINMGISGSSASKRTNLAENAESWNGRCFTEVVDYITGGEGNEYLSEEQERIGLLDVDYHSVDYFLIAYGINDYYTAVNRESEDPYDVYSYAGALRTGIEKLQETYPEAEIIVLSPTYTQMYSYGEIVADSHELDYGGGTGTDYLETARKVAQECGVTFFDMYKPLSVNQYNGPRILSDATHFTTKGLWMYSQVLVDYILEMYGKEENPFTFKW